METSHFSGTSLGEKGFSISSLNPLGSNVWPEPFIASPVAAAKKSLASSIPSIPLCATAGELLSACSPTARLNRPSSLPPPLIHNPLGSHCGSWQGPHVPLAQHCYVGTVPAGLVAPVLADPGAALPVPCRRCLRSSQARRRDPNNQGICGKHHHHKRVRRDGTAGSVPPPPRAVSAEGHGPCSPGATTLPGPFHHLQDAAVEAPRGVQAPDEVPVVPVGDVGVGDEVGDAGQQ